MRSRAQVRPRLLRSGRGSDARGRLLFRKVRRVDAVRCAPAARHGPAARPPQAPRAVRRALPRPDARAVRTGNRPAGRPRARRAPRAARLLDPDQFRRDDHAVPLRSRGLVLFSDRRRQDLSRVRAERADRTRTRTLLLDGDRQHRPGRSGGTRPAEGTRLPAAARPRNAPAAELATLGRDDGVALGLICVFLRDRIARARSGGRAPSITTCASSACGRRRCGHIPRPTV